MAPDRPLKVAVVILCAMDSAMWLLYSESVVMAIVWAAIAIAFIVWIVKDIQNA